MCVHVCVCVCVCQSDYCLIGLVRIWVIWQSAHIQGTCRTCCIAVTDKSERGKEGERERERERARERERSNGSE